MLRNLASFDTEVGLKKFTFLCESDASLPHCLEAVKRFEAYLMERLNQAEQQNKCESKECANG